MNKTKIEWCDYVWNPVWGCFNHCSYCYARKIAKRFGNMMYDKEANWYNKNMPDLENDFLRDEFYYTDFFPVFLNSNFHKSFPKKPSRIFVNSMSDIWHWRADWMHKVLNKIKEYPQHKFLFLTKSPEVYIKYCFSDNCWLGYTSDNGDIYTDKNWQPYPYLRFVSFEPLLITPNYRILLNDLPTVDWIIIGAQTNPYKPPKKEWIEIILDVAEKFKIPVFMKHNLKKIWPDLIQKFPRGE